MSKIIQNTILISYSNFQNQKQYSKGKKVISFIEQTSLNESQKREGGECRADSLLLVFLAKMRSGTYVDFREGPPALVNIVGVGD